MRFRSADLEEVPTEIVDLVALDSLWGILLCIEHAQQCPLPENAPGSNPGDVLNCLQQVHSSRISINHQSTSLISFHRTSRSSN